MVHIRCQTQISPLQKRFFPGEWTNFLPAIESIPPKDESGCCHAQRIRWKGLRRFLPRISNRVKEFSAPQAGWSGGAGAL